MKDEQREGRSSIDDIIELYKKDVDRTLLRENLKLTVEQRFEQLMNMQVFVEEAHRAGRKLREAA
ncbi:MAG: hypothetical protein MSG64_12970 [Pyrinomonadaceae bacterium MAG19_C2-C3]|nr:hypothetical protein [Pyrinomonadaceae bacterium MAG19_C2-C3]